ncbi:MAG TPA: acetoin utilization protein AcuC [Micromonosporaceae bacterium]|nr:acetoin utilization protein AcuC [Micromonosporaceae bacterium]
MIGTLVLWDEALLAYDLGDHPLDPVRVELTVALARALGVLDRPGVTVEAPAAATDEALLRVHTAEYVNAIREASAGVRRSGYGLGTSDNPIFPGIHEASALIAGATLRAAEAVWLGEAGNAVNIAGGLHHAMPDRASGFCVYNDPAVAIARLLGLGAERIAYVDIDVHHGDGVQEIFYDDPRVLTVSVHESPRTLFPGTGYPSETGGPAAEGSAVNVALPPGVDDAGWLRAFAAVVPSVLRAFRPQILFTQCGADAYRSDPLANLRLTVDGQRASYLALRAIADEVCDGRWVATGGGGYALVECVPRAWTHLLAIATGEPVDPVTATPQSWRELVRQRRPREPAPLAMTDGADPGYLPWQPGDGADALDRAIQTTRRLTFPHFGLDPYDPRD